ncbi:hypothetical protein FRACYDRAFT_208758, partial [Fragilariopsis cylindrus CCMP1102]
MSSIEGINKNSSIIDSACSNNEIRKEEILNAVRPESIESANTETEEWTNLNDNKDNNNSKINNNNKNGNDSDHGSGGVVNSKSTPLVASSNHSVASARSAASGNSKKKKVTKRRSWKKPKDKPKRPLSAYNIFFKHTRSRIVEGFSEEGTVEETIQSIEGIVANSTETRRHRKTHGQISFGDLARRIADKWKTIGKNQKTLFDHYASLDMKRYR